MHRPERLEHEQKSGAIFVGLLFSAGLIAVDPGFPSTDAADPETLWIRWNQGKG